MTRPLTAVLDEAGRRITRAVNAKVIPWRYMYLASELHKAAHEIHDHMLQESGMEPPAAQGAQTSRHAGTGADDGAVSRRTFRGGHPMTAHPPASRDSAARLPTTPTGDDWSEKMDCYHCTQKVVAIEDEARIKTLVGLCERLDDWFPCTCDPAYKDRGLEAPDCPHHDLERWFHEEVAALSGPADPTEGTE